MTKKYIKDRVGEICLHDFDGASFENIICQLNDKCDWAKSKSPTMKNIYLDLNYSKYDLDGSDTPYFIIIVERLENDKEYDDRIKAEKKEKERKAKIAAREKTKREKFEEKEYLRLQKKFGNKV
jgi:hypothetical protein